jgi:hypothetical protein
MSGNAVGGNDVLTGVNNFLNQFYGDAASMFDFAHGGDDILTGSSNSGNGNTENQLIGDAGVMSGFTTGGNDTLIGGNSTGTGQVTNTFFGDAQSLSGSAKGGNDTLIAGTTGAGGTVTNDMWGDGQLQGSAQGGTDMFVFKDAGSMMVGTHNTIEDFSQSQGDKIEFANVTGVQSFHDLVIAHSGADTIITAGADQVTLHNFTHSLTASDFLIA